MVQSGSKPAFFCVYIESGFSPCQVGITVAPNKHNSSIFKFFGWLSLVLFLRLTHARELYTISYHGAIFIPFLPICTETMVSLILIIKLGDLLADHGVIC